MLPEPALITGRLDARARQARGDVIRRGVESGRRRITAAIVVRRQHGEVPRELFGRDRLRRGAHRRRHHRRRLRQRHGQVQNGSGTEDDTFKAGSM